MDLEEEEKIADSADLNNKSKFVTKSVRQGGCGMINKKHIPEVNSDSPADCPNI